MNGVTLTQPSLKLLCVFEAGFLVLEVTNKFTLKLVFYFFHGKGDIP